jgi:hypothetical protein
MNYEEERKRREYEIIKKYQRPKPKELPYLLRLMGWLILGWNVRGK